MTQSTAHTARRKANRPPATAVVCLFHVCPARRLSSVLRAGILPALSQGSRPECWLVTRSRRRWAVAHVRIRHRSESVAVVRVAVPRGWLTRRKRGVWTTSRPIAPEMIQSVRPAQFVA